MKEYYCCFSACYGGRIFSPGSGLIGVKQALCVTGSWCLARLRLTSACQVLGMIFKYKGGDKTILYLVQALWL